MALCGKATGTQYPATYRLVFQYMMGRHQIIMSLTVIGVVMGCVLFAFWFYHFAFLAARNSTTNEQHKYGQLQSFMRWRARKKKEAADRAAADDNGAGGDEQNGDGTEREKERKYLFADFDMKQWGGVNVYDRGIWNNLKMVYCPYSNVQPLIDSAHKKDDDASNGDEGDDHHQDGDKEGNAKEAESTQSRKRVKVSTQKQKVQKLKKRRRAKK